MREKEKEKEEEVGRILGVAFHGATAVLVLTGTGRLRVVESDASGNKNMEKKEEEEERVEPLMIEINDTTNVAYASLCNKMFGEEYLGKITEIKELLLESEKR